MLSYIFVGAIGLCAGALIGYNIQTKQIKEHMEYLNDLQKRLKEANNQMLENFSKTYHAATGTEGQFTDIDDQLMDMWME